MVSSSPYSSSRPVGTGRGDLLWQHERARFVQLAVAVVARAPRGKVKSAARAIAQRYAWRRFRSRPGRKLPLSTASILRHFYNWRKIGCDAFRLDYHPRRQSRFGPEDKNLMLLDCLDELSFSITQSWQRWIQTGAKPCSYQQFRRMLGEDNRAQLKPHYKWRRTLWRSRTKPT